MTDRNVSSIEGSGLTSQSLLQKARENEEGAWARIVNLYSPLLEYWCRMNNAAKDHVADICQEVLIQVHKSLPRFEHNQQPGAFRKWLRQITYTKCTDHWRKEAKQQAERLDDVDWPDPVDSSEEEKAEQEVCILYRRALEILSTEFQEKTWKAFWRVVIDEQRPSEVADELGMTPEAVSSAKWRILRTLRTELRELVE